MNILGYTLEMTCGACPEQYDVKDERGNIVGELYLRGGIFTASYINNSLKNKRQRVYEVQPRGDGIFESHEREFYLTEAVIRIDREINGPKVWRF